MSVLVRGSFLFAALLGGLSHPALAETRVEQAAALTADEAAELSWGLEDPDVAIRVQEALIRQIQTAEPLAVVDGLWAVPVDPRPLADAAGLALANDGLYDLDDLGRVEGLVVLVPDALYQELNDLAHQEVTEALGQIDALNATAEGAQEAARTDILWIVVAAGLYVAENAVLVAEVGGAVVGVIVYEDLDYSDPNEDYDRDGVTNRKDTDDDDDGVPDVDDRAPFDEKDSICDLCGTGANPANITGLLGGPGVQEAVGAAWADAGMPRLEATIPASEGLPALAVGF